MRRLSLALGIVLLMAGCSSKSRSRRVRVAAASDLAKAFTELGAEFEKKTGIAPEFNFGSSGQLSKQIEQGAPFFLFASANKAFVEKVVAAGRCDAKTQRMYARGRIVVWTANGKPAPATLDDLAKPAYQKIAIANPDHAPYGVAAKQALEKVGVWSKIADRIVLAENVQATMLYAKNGDADAAVVALSLAVVTDGGSFLRIDPALHDVLDQQLVVCGSGDEADAARQLAAFIASPEGREVMTRYGFQLPEQGSAAP
ncbi:MAG: molybdate ABC transporter substrate-binding protein [Kofleriaceae bacterium]|nr:molybdate ABC transporter substrate-binding protein [Kofleriaceae bacterium]